MEDDINLEYGMQLIENARPDNSRQEQPSPTLDLEPEEDEYDQLENFEDSPRQEKKQIGQNNRYADQDLRNEEQKQETDRTSPQITIPDMDNDSLLSN